MDNPKVQITPTLKHDVLQFNVWCPPKGTAMSRNLSRDIKTKIIIETSDDNMAIDPIRVHVQDEIHSWDTLW